MAGTHCVDLKFQRSGAVLEVVGDRMYLPWELALLAHRDETDPPSSSKGSPEHESTSLNTSYDVKIVQSCCEQRGIHPIDDVADAERVRKQRIDVAKVHTSGWPVDYDPNVLIEKGFEFGHNYFLRRLRLEFFGC